MFGPKQSVIQLDIGFEPEAAVSGPVLLQTDDDTFLTFNAVRMAGERRETAGTGVIEIQGCSVTKFGYPNDEALAGHPLYKHGLGAYGVFEVKKSIWIQQMTEQNRVSFPQTTESRRRHFVFTFHDSTFECVADEIRATLRTEPYEQIFAEIAGQILRSV